MTRDFYDLRREGIHHLERSGSAQWTDYNTHDPGITILEALAYALTELSYRTGLPIEDLLAPAATGPVPEGLYPDQTFYTPRTILTVNPTTAEDVRRLLIDLEAVRNAWVRCDSGCCDPPFYAWCERNELVLSHDPGQRSDPTTPVVTVEPRGLYAVLLDLEPDPSLGDLNDRMIVRRFTLTDDDGRRHQLTIEVRFPEWGRSRRDERARLAADDGDVTADVTIDVPGLTRTTTGTAPVDDAELRRHWFDVFYADFTIHLEDGLPLTIDNVSVRLYGNDTVRNLTTVQSVLEGLTDSSEEGFLAPYRRKLSATDIAIEAARTALESHRNLDEDCCGIELVQVDDIAVCADIEVEPTADIELVQAWIWYEIERYLDPPVDFWSLDELRARGTPVEEIFNGPELDHGFLTRAGLGRTELRSELRASDIINRLMDIEGVTSVGNLLLTAYDSTGNPLRGFADPKPAGAGRVADPERVSAAWLLVMRPGHRPRLHRKLSAILFSSRSLPFRPRFDEAEDTLIQLRGQFSRPKLSRAELDLWAPIGRPRSPGTYHPVQYSLPAAYGVGPAGLASTATGPRRAQAKQLKAYLMVYEQLLRHAYAQLDHVGDLFSVDPGIRQTYFTSMFDDQQIIGSSDVLDGLTEDGLALLAESPAEFQERRSRFLDHLLARFGESFAEYAMLHADLQGHGRGPEELVDARLALLRAVPRSGHDRGRAFDRGASACTPGNVSGFQQRVNLLLGLPADARAIVVEHLLLRPKFPGDALYPACTDGPCGVGRGGGGCGEEDPYSFRLTYVMPAWTAPFDTNLEMRSFADRTIREQAPSHLLVKTCWVGNDGHRPDPCDPIIDVLTALLHGPVEAQEDACRCAAAVLAVYREAFDDWFADHRLVHQPPEVLATTLAEMFHAQVDLSEVPCSAVIDASVRAELQEPLVEHFVEIARRGYQFDRFEDDWCAWAEADAAIDWMNEHLQDTVLDILTAGVTGPAADRQALCSCASDILTAFGTGFREWMDTNIAASTPLEEFTGFDPPVPVLCAGVTFTPGVAETIRTLLKQRSDTYAEVSYRLHHLVHALAELHNSYPRATLHDCDAGSDVNPVRLGQTALGSN
jgi:hypothetical protein